MSKYIIAVDSGTQSTRVTIFTTSGAFVCKGTAKHPDLICEHQGWAEHGETDNWDGLCAATKDCLGKFKGDPKDILAIGLSTQRYVTIPVDRDGKMIHRPFSWMDQRVAYGLEPLPEGTPPMVNFLRMLSKPNWCSLNDPETFENAYKWLNLSGYFTWRLCGTCLDSISNMVGVWPIDPINWKLSEDLGFYSAIGMRRDQVADLIRPGEVLGRVTAEAAAETGFPEGCVVVATAGDKQCEVLGGGCVEEGQTYITFGTLCSLDLAVKKYSPSADFSHACYLSAVPGIYNCEVALNKGYWIVSWLRDNLALDLEETAKERGMSVEALLNEGAEGVPAGSEGLVIIPDWQAPAMRPNSKGMMIGFDDRHGRKHIFKALLEGISQQLKIDADAMCGVIDQEITELRIGGGGSLSPIAMQATADIFNVPVIRLNTSETCSLGAAVCAAVGVGEYPDLATAVKHMVHPQKTFLPIPGNQKLYEEIREKVHKKIYPALADVFQDLNCLTGEA